MKIAYVISTPPFAWGTGGSAKVVYDQAKALASRGHQVSILSTDILTPDKMANQRINPEKIDGFDLFRFPCNSSWLAWKYKIYVSSQLITYIKNHISDYDIVHLQDLISVHAIATLKYCKKNGIPYILTAHGSIPWLQDHRLVNILYNKTIGVSLLVNASMITALTDLEKKQLLEMGVDLDKIRIIPNGVNEEEYCNLPTHGKFRKKFNINPNDNIILFLGRIHKIKGLDLLLKAFVRVHNDVSDSKLVIAGPDDGYLLQLKKLAKDLQIQQWVVFTGPLYGTDKAEAFLDADEYVLPSYYDAFPISLLESLAYGKPVIVTTDCAISDLIASKGGLVVNPNPIELSSAIMTLIHDREMREALGIAGRNFVFTYYNWSRIIDDIENLYFQVQMNNRY